VRFGYLDATWREKADQDSRDIIAPGSLQPYLHRAPQRTDKLQPKKCRVVDRVDLQPYLTNFGI
jgi:hypothetical protein